MTIRELIEYLEDYDPDTQIFVMNGDLHNPNVVHYEHDSDLPDVLVIS